jgi:endonuclease/exonuclease/phosphatase family metal-dependent hydrolase
MTASRSPLVGRLLSSFLLSSLLLLSLLGLGACGGGSKPGAPLKVMTWNMYLGAALDPLATVPTPDALPAVTATLWGKVQATDFPSRAKIMATHIQALAPDLVALQECSLYRTQTPSDYHSGDAPNATVVTLDFLATLVAALDAQGGGYHVVSEALNGDNELPVSDGAGGLFDLRLTDRDVILARDGVTATNQVQTKYAVHFNFTSGGVGGVPLVFTRSLSHVDVQVGDAAFTFATSHLEVNQLSVVQMAQAQELVAALDPTLVPGPLVLIGDFNSHPGMDSYPLLTQSFHDLAAGLPAPATDVTCCQADDLKNPTSQADQRIDLVLTRGAFGMKSLTPVGTDATADRAPGGQWASDHFGVYSELTLSN